METIAILIVRMMIGVSRFSILTKTFETYGIQSLCFVDNRATKKKKEPN